MRKSADAISLVTVELGEGGFGLVLDVSEGGAGIQVMNRVLAGTKVPFALKVPEFDGQILGSGIVAWSDGNGRIGVTFQEFQNNSDLQLKKWIEVLPEATTDEPLVPTQQLGGEGPLKEQLKDFLPAETKTRQLDTALILQFLIEQVTSVTHSSGGAIALDEAGQMVCRASTGLAPDVGVTIGEGSALTSECIQSGDVVLCDDTERDPRVDPAICRELNLRSSLIVPLLFEAKVRGVLEVFSPRPYAFLGQHVSLLRQAADFTVEVVYGAAPSTAAQLEASAKGKVTLTQETLRRLINPAAAPEQPEKPKAIVAPPRIESPPPSPVAQVPPKVEPLKQEARKPVDPPMFSAVTHDEASGLRGLLGLNDRIRQRDYVEEEPEPSDRRPSILLYIAAALLVISIVAYGLTRFVGARDAQPTTSNPAPAAQEPQAAPVETPPPPAQHTPSRKKGKAHTSELQERESNPDVAADVVRSRQAAIVLTDGSFPIEIASRNAPLPKTEIPAAEQPTVELNSNASLNRVITLSGPTSKPNLRPEGVVTGGKVLHQVEPAYPVLAKQQRIQGEVVLAARVKKDGSVENVRRVRGNPALGPAAVEALKQWKYDPYRLNGQPQDVDISVTMQFRLK